MNFQNPFLNPYMNPYQVPAQNMIQPSQVVKVNGENGARAYQIGANSSALLLDESGLMVWLVTSDGAGYKTVSAYDITPHQTAPAPDYGSLEGRIKRLEEIVNATADSSAARRRDQSVSADYANDQNGQISRKSSAHAESNIADESGHEAGNGDNTRVWRGRE